MIDRWKDARITYTLLGMCCALVFSSHAMAQFTFPTGSPVSQVEFATPSGNTLGNSLAFTPPAEPLLIESRRNATRSIDGTRPMATNRTLPPAASVTKMGVAIPTVIASNPNAEPAAMDDQRRQSSDLSLPDDWMSDRESTISVALLESTPKSSSGGFTEIQTGSLIAPSESVIAPKPDAVVEVPSSQSYSREYEGRPRIVFQPAVPARGPRGQSILRPTVQLADTPGVEILPIPDTFSNSVPLLEADDGRLPRSVSAGVDRVWVPWDLTKRVKTFREQRRKPIQQMYHGLRAALDSQRCRDVGIGAERLPFALFEMDAAKPSNNFRLRFEMAYDWEFPDRAEYFWSQMGTKGPTVPDYAKSFGYDPSVDYQDIRMSFEIGGPRFSATTEIPLRFVNPTFVGNVAGMGDMVLTTKTVMIDGDSLRLTQVLRNQFPTGSATSGRGVGHVSMEPGFSGSYKWSERTMLHSELKLWFPLGGTPQFSGEVLRYGFGYANLLYDSDSFAVIPTFEFVGWSVLRGKRTIGALSGKPITGDVDNENIINLYPGVRFVQDGDGDLGLFELGISSGVSITERHWYRSLLRFDLRWTF